VALCELIRVMKTRYPNVNLLFLDEVLDGLDAHGVQSILKILRRTCYELQLNTFIISWNPLPREMFDYVVLVDKKNGFSSLSVEAA
jgi:ABC-type multidrug transport system ATPase subunit